MEYGLIGEHLPHSYSKLIHEEIGDYAYELHEIAKPDLDAFMLARDFKAINVTIPYKQDVIPYLDWIHPQAKAIGAVNTIVNREGKLYGYNTDFFGMSMLLQREGIEIEGKKTLILGSGGTSKTAAAVLSQATEHVVKVSRSGVSFSDIDRMMEEDGHSEKKVAAGNIIPPDFIEALKKRGQEIVLNYQVAEHFFADVQVIINTTPMGMYPKTDAAAIDLKNFKAVEGVLDAIYNPLRTKLVIQGSKAGARATGGLFMLVAQAVIAHDIFLTKTEDLTSLQTDDFMVNANTKELCERIYKKLETEKTNIVLIGMPGSGKSTVGRRLQQATGRRILELDEMLVEKAGMEITEIFAKYGEAHFRDLESELIREVSTETGVIVSTGGGCILRPENIDDLKQNGKVFFLDRPLESLLPTADRPTASSAEAIKKRYEERYEIYVASADVIVARPEGSRSAAEMVLERL